MKFCIFMLLALGSLSSFAQSDRGLNSVPKGSTITILSDMLIMANTSNDSASFRTNKGWGECTVIFKSKPVDRLIKAGQKFKVKHVESYSSGGADLELQSSKIKKISCVFINNTSGGRAVKVSEFNSMFGVFHLDVPQL